MTIQINDLPSDLLSYLFEFLPFKQLFIIESVCLKWKLCLNKTMKNKTTLNLLFDLKGTNLFEIYGPHKNSLEYVIDDNNIDILKIILTKCPNIKSMNVHSTLVTGNNNLITIANLCPKLETIKYLNADVSDEEWNEFASKVGPKLIECIDVCGVKYDQIFNINRVKSLFKQLKNIEILEYHSMENEEDEKELFSYLNSCENLRSLKWYRYKAYEFDDSMICVFQRLDRLDISLRQLRRINFPLNNLKELSIKPPGRSENISSQIYKNTFDNLTKLRIGIDCLHYFTELINLCKLKFPKLESLEIHTNDRSEEFPKSFIIHIKQMCIKNLKLITVTPNPNIISSLTQLENIELICSLSHCFYEQNYEIFCKCIDAMTKHKSLKRIIFKIRHYKSDIRIFDKIIQLDKIKPNVNIRIIRYINVILRSETQQDIDEYDKKFYETQKLVKFNMELIKI